MLTISLISHSPLYHTRHKNKKPLEIKPQNEEQEELPRLTIKEKMEKYVEEMRRKELK